MWRLWRGHWKRSPCIKLSVEIDFRICSNFAHPSCDVRKELRANFAQIWRAICDKFAQCPPRARPLLGISGFKSSWTQASILFFFDHTGKPPIIHSLPKCSAAPLFPVWTDQKGFHHLMHKGVSCLLGNSVALNTNPTSLLQEKTKDLEDKGSRSFSRDRSRIIRTSLFAPKHSKTCVGGGFIHLKRGVTKLWQLLEPSISSSFVAS